MSPTSTHKKSNGSDGSRSFSVQRQQDINSSQQQERPSYSRNAADLLIANVMGSMEAREQGEKPEGHKSQSEPGAVSVADIVMRQPELPIAPATSVSQPLGEMGIQRQCSDCQQQQQGLEEGKDSDEMSLRVGIQTKLTVGAPGDKYEQEADRMAAQVMRMSVAAAPLPIVQRFGEEDNPVHRWSLAQSITPIVHRRVDEQVQMQALVQRAFQAGGTEASGDLESRLNASKGGGSALAPEVRSFMEPRFGADFSGVRVHTGSSAVQMNQELHAQAFAIGSDIYFGAGKSPGNNELTAHELTHVVQQTGEITPKTIQRREFGEEVRFDSLPGNPPRARMLGPYSDEAIARTLYGDASVPISHVPGSSDTVLIEYDQLLAEWRGFFSVDSGERESDGRAVLEFIKRQARARAQTPYTVSTSSRFFTRLRDYYLQDYLADPSRETGQEAIERIDRPMEGRVEALMSEEPGYEGTIDDTPSPLVIGQRVFVTPHGGQEREAADRWEAGAITVWNNESIPAIPDIPLFRNLRGLPSNIGAATDILTLENRQRLPFIDTPFLLGEDNPDSSDDMVDVRGGGRNLSQLMHWATGVGNAQRSEAALHELFLLYEMWHLEGWDVFGEDAINDLIVEEQGRLLGEELARGGEPTIQDEASLAVFLNSSFQQARAWVGKLLRERESELEQWILAEVQPRATFHRDEGDQRDVWQRRPSIRQMVRDRMSMDDILSSSMVNAQIEIYRLLYEAEIWEQTHGQVELTELEQRLLRGELNDLLNAAAQGNFTSAAIAASDLDEDSSH